MDSKRERERERERKGREESDIEAISTPSQIVTRKKDKKRKNRKESDQDQITALTKRVDEIGNCLNELTEIVKKLDKNSEISSKEEKETPKTKEYLCLFESEDLDLTNRQTIFVRGFDCSFPMDDIKSALIKHFSSCGEVSHVYVPYECITGSPLGFAFINMDEYPEKALALDGSCLGGMTLEVTMAIKRGEYYGYTNRRGCGRCGSALIKRRLKSFQEGSIIRIPPGTVFETDLSGQDDEAIADCHS